MSSRRKRRSAAYSLSFLDCICCGFGAIILLFIVTMGVQSREINELRRILENTVLQRKLKLADYQIKTDEVNVMLDLERTRRRRTESERTTLDALIAQLRQNISDREKSRELFITDIESLKKELAVMQVEIDIEQNVIKPTAIGIPVESNHIAIVVDTSGSMRDSSTNMIRSYVVQKMEDLFNAYPGVKGVQLLDADGRFILGNRMGGGWLPDSAELRELMVRQVRLYPVESGSNPVPGIRRAIRTLYDPQIEDMKFGIYVFGDEFTGRPEPVVEEMRRLNRDRDGNRIALINAIGFPNVIQASMLLNQSGLKFAKLMHDLTYEHGGAFIGLEQDKLDAIDREQRGRFPPPPMPPSRRPGIIWGI